MAPKHRRSGSEAGILSRQGELFSGGPAEGAIQSLHPAAQFVVLMILLLGISLCQNGIMLFAVFLVAIIVAIFSYLNVISIFKIVAFPLALLAIPSWLVAVMWYGLPFHAGGIFFLRTLASVTVASVGLHSIGLRRMNIVLHWFRLPMELRQMWSIMISQIAGFSELLTDMALARLARAVVRPPGFVVRRQAGRQMGILFSRTYQRGNQLAFAMDARRITYTGDCLPENVVQGGRWRAPEFAAVWISVAIAVVVGGLF